MINTLEEFYEYLENCIDGNKKTKSHDEVNKLKVNVLKFQNNFSNLLIFNTEIIHIYYHVCTMGYFDITTNHSDYNKKVIYRIWFNKETKVFYLKNESSSYHTFIYTDDNKNTVLSLINKLRLDSIEEQIRKISKIQNNFNKLLIKSNLEFTI